MNRILECVPNFSEGRDLKKIERIVDAFRAKENVKLLDYSNDKDHNRMVVTVIGEPEAVKNAVIEAVGIAIREIDLTRHQGEHPRMGAADVIPFIPLEGLSLDEVDTIAKEVGKTLAGKYQLPVYLYEKSASAEHRRNLASVRKGEFEGLTDKMQLSEWKPDFGPEQRHPTAGAAIVGARMPLIAFNIHLNTTRLDIADNIARKVRCIGGGLRYCKAMGVNLKEKGLVQVSMNLTDYTQTSIYQAVEMVRFEAKRYGVTVAGCELIGLLPLQAVTDTVAYYLGLEGFSGKQVLEMQYPHDYL
ncbi:MAG: Glutamate formimidoyltransferase [Candidatus Ordinivivax streblomastigis]|uniref:glutamate formimidoyltransferase n=1 Tax=Candidatus Ordinivivax streblomastigis TaxID=2540710 RepID=A0A5M8NZX0_9BACT|nr:MAG: Glutamate formimidoyltransferase [Candidatus Ordinivivax streblomastigis]